VDVKKQIAYWKKSAEEDWDLSKDLVIRNKTRHGLFFAHLALEKILKGCVCRSSGGVSPKIHALPRLAQLAGLTLEVARIQFLSEFDRYQLEGRYPDMIESPPTQQEAREAMEKAEEVFIWLMQQL
jgi:HEPN domain-containing protein